MQAQMVDDILEDDRKFRKALEDLISKYHIKIDLAQLEREREKHAKKDLKKIKLEKRMKLIANIEKQLEDQDRREK